MSTKPIRDLSIGVVGTGLAAFAIYQSMLLRVWIPSRGVPGEGLYPLVVAGVIGIASLSIVVNVTISDWGNWKSHGYNMTQALRERRSDFLKQGNPVKIAAIGIALIGLVGLTERIGFFPSQFLFLFALITIVERRSLPVGVSAALLITAFFYFVFQVGLGIPFPAPFFAE